MTGDHIRLKIALVSTSRWLAVAMYGEAQVYQRITQEIMGLCLHRYPPA
ncbi:HutP family protein [Klebsiella pneumoniae]